jgi:predicted DNA-binding transcriptional regulator AlpA
VARPRRTFAPVDPPQQAASVVPFEDGALTVPQACRWSGLSRSELFRLMGKGVLPYTTPTRGRRVCKATLREHLRRHQVVRKPQLWEARA